MTPGLALGLFFVALILWDLPEHIRSSRRIKQLRRDLGYRA